ncbi:MAG TPA: hypothetical protein VFD22_00165 [Gemmatimonadaceae bacterium]|nr:hypothetical protein [Gemmatimonadaceae bacterium]
MMKTLRIGAVAFAIVTAAACRDSKPESGDTSRAVFRNTGEAAHVDMVRIDSMAAKPSPSAVPNTPAPRTSPAAVPPRMPPVIGETRREAPVSRDPMPPLRGETSKGATMPVYRDSTQGPLMGIDSKGKVVPIKKLEY